MLIRGGKVVTESSTKKQDVRVEDGKIAKLAASIPKKTGEEVFDATGLFVLPGMVDAHVHFRDFKDVAKEDWLSGSSAALAGGVTSVLEMPNSSLPTISIEALEAKRLVASRKALCDYGFFFGATDDNVEAATAAQKERDVAGLKVFLGSSTGGLLVKDFGALYGHLASATKPVAVHAEDAACLDYFAQAVLPSVENHSKLRDPLCAELAIAKALTLAERAKANLHVCHISTAEELAWIRDAKKRGLPVTCEVSPHHLFLDESATQTLENLAKVNPPLRSKAAQAAVWKSLSAGEIDLVATDHAPHAKADKQVTYLEAPSGMPGLDTALPLLLNAVHQKRLALEDVVRLYSFAPARRFNLQGKGRIEKGFDADLTLVDLAREHEILAGNLFTKCGWSAFEGWKLKGSVEHVFVRGSLAFSEGSIRARLPFGKPVSMA